MATKKQAEAKQAPAEEPQNNPDAASPTNLTHAQTHQLDNDSVQPTQPSGGAAVSGQPLSVGSIQQDKLEAADADIDGKKVTVYQPIVHPTDGTLLRYDPVEVDAKDATRTASTPRVG